MSNSTSMVDVSTGARVVPVDPDREPVTEEETEGHAVPRLSRAGAAVRRMAIDVTPLRESRAFRLLTFGQLISLTGRQVITVALPIQIYLLTHSTFALGLVGPAAAGFIIAAPSSRHAGLALAYGADVATFVASIGTTMALPSLPPHRVAGEPAPTGWRSVKEGFRFLRGKRVLISTFVIDLDAMIFGMPRALFPVLAIAVFHRGPLAVGLLFAAPAAGAVIGALTTGWVGRVRHQGRAVIWAVVAWGAAITLFGFSGRFFWLGLVLLAVAGAADMVSAVF